MQCEDFLEAGPRRSAPILFIGRGPDTGHQYSLRQFSEQECVWIQTSPEAGSAVSRKTRDEFVRQPDVNNDGRADLIGRSGDDLRVGISNGSAFQLPTQWTTWNPAYDYRLADVNVDGATIRELGDRT
jgi:hypothetical protein